MPWYRALGTSRTQIWALWKPGKPKGDISETLFLLQIALELTPKEIHDTNSEKYWCADFMLTKMDPSKLKDEGSRAQGS